MRKPANKTIYKCTRCNADFVNYGFHPKKYREKCRVEMYKFFNKRAAEKRKERIKLSNGIVAKDNHIFLKAQLTTLNKRRLMLWTEMQKIDDMRNKLVWDLIDNEREN